MGQSIQNPVVGQLLQQLFQLQGDVRPVLEEFIVPTVQVGDLSLGGPPPVSRHATATDGQAAVAAERFVARFEMPGNTIAVIRRVMCDPATGGQSLAAFFGSSFAVTPTVAAPKSFTDGRVLDEANQFPAGVLVTDTQVAALATEHWSKVVPAPGDGLIYEPPAGWVVGTGRPNQFGFVEFAYNALNQAIANFTLEWDEYQIF